MLIATFLLQVAQEPLNLTCFGNGTANDVSVVSTYGQGNIYGNVGGKPYSGRASGNALTYVPTQQEFQDQVDVRLFGGDDRIRMPRVMLPTVRGGEDGWFRIKNISSDPRSIKGKVAINFINSPNLYIDRVTGVIRLSGKAGDYVGKCEAVQGDAKAKF